MSWNLPQRADGFRYIILYKYGGLYFDLDVLFLRDLAGLLEHEFSYAWEGQSYANSAILNLQQKSNLSKYLLEKSISQGTVLPWMIFNYEDPLLAEIFLLPCAFFDPVWMSLRKDNFPIYDFYGLLTSFDDIFTNRLDIHSY